MSRFGSQVANVGVSGRQVALGVGFGVCERLQVRIYVISFTDSAESAEKQDRSRCMQNLH